MPAGEGALVRLIRTSPNSWTHSDSTAVTVQPGETTQVTLGDTGAVLVGRARFDNAPTNFSALTFEGNLSSQMPPLPAFNSPAEAQAFHKSPEWKAMMKGHKTYAIEMRPDGSFSVDNVAPGDYSLNIFVRPAGERPWQQPPLGNGHLMVTVPDSASPAAPIDIGEVAIQPNQAP